MTFNQLFTGQAGRGNNEEFGLLSLEFDENFCMGGPGIIMSRETLRRGKLNVINNNVLSKIYGQFTTQQNIKQYGKLLLYQQD